MQLSRFYFHESIFELAGKELSDSYKTRPTCKLFLNCTLINVRFKKIINDHISFTTEQIMESVKSEDYSSNFNGLIALGENLAFPVPKKYDRNKNANLIKAANSKNIEIVDDVKIVTSGLENTVKIKKLLEDGKYPETLKVINVEEALQQIMQIHDDLKSLNSTQKE